MKHIFKRPELPSIIYKLAIYKSMGGDLNQQTSVAKVRPEINMLKEANELFGCPQELLEQLNLTDMEISLLSFVFEE